MPTRFWYEKKERERRGAEGERESEKNPIRHNEERTNERRHRIQWLGAHKGRLTIHIMCLFCGRNGSSFIKRCAHESERHRLTAQSHYRRQRHRHIHCRSCVCVCGCERMAVCLLNRSFHKILRIRSLEWWWIFARGGGRTLIRIFIDSHSASMQSTVDECECLSFFHFANSHPNYCHRKRNWLKFS